MMNPSPPTAPLLEVQNLKKHFPVRSGFLNRVTAHVHAVEDVSFQLYPGETLGVVGESGCGKSTLARCIIRLNEPDAGRVHFDGEDWLALRGAALQRKRADMQMIFQNPYASLNPRHSIGTAIAEPLVIFKKSKGRALDRRVGRLLEMVGLPQSAMNRMPSELSGGQRQRVCIARALALEPKLIIADEAVSALDVSVQAQVLNLLDDLKQELGLTYLFIAHNLSVVEHFCDRVMVMYLGQVMESAATRDLFESPQHPYTRALLSAAPVADPVRARQAQASRVRLSGDLPNPMHPPSGCRFHTRCPEVFEPCDTREPAMFSCVSGRQGAPHGAKCHLLDDALAPKVLTK